MLYVDATHKGMFEPRVDLTATSTLEPLPFIIHKNNDKVMKKKLNRKIHSVEYIKP